MRHCYICGEDLTSERTTFEVLDFNTAEPSYREEDVCIPCIAALDDTTGDLDAAEIAEGLFI